MMKKEITIKICLTLLPSLFLVNLYAQKLPLAIKSPDNSIEVTVTGDASKHIYYSILYKGLQVLRLSKLGLVREDESFAEGLTLINASAVTSVKDSYELFTGKKRYIDYTANKRILHFQNKNGKKVNIIFQISNDGVAFRYYFPESSPVVVKVTSEITSFHFNTSAKAFLQPIAVSKSGWEKTNPSYEENYVQNIAVGTPSTLAYGWVYPALFNYKNAWILITESSLDSNYCATRLSHESPDGEYSISFPDPREVIAEDGLLPRSGKPFYSPWRIITIGSLKTIIESTLGTDLAKPSVINDKSFIKPGKASWSWINSKDDFIVYDEQKKYIDFAADMHWQYCLIDVDWDTKIGYEKIKELTTYAATKNVGVLVWYNSAGNWNTVKYTPKDKLLTHETRVKEFSLLKEMGIKGVKIDFFGGDGQSVIKYYLEILNDAASYGLLVNFHGATLPRGWQRTYPNLITTEAVKGFEMVTFLQADADVQPNHCAMLPFTRNVFDPMDFTPMNLYKIPTQVKRRTTSGFELALSVLFLSGIQHFAESPDGMSHVPGYVKSFLQTLPTRWDDVKFIDGYPGKYVVLARRAGSKWYLTGINGENNERTFKPDFSIFGKNVKKATLITDGSEPLTFTNKVMQMNGTGKQIVMQPNGGFVVVLE